MKDRRTGEANSYSCKQYRKHFKIFVPCCVFSEIGYAVFVATIQWSVGADCFSKID